MTDKREYWLDRVLRQNLRHWKRLPRCVRESDWTSEGPIE